METIKSLDTLSFGSLFTAFNEAFRDYEIQVNSEELSVMLSRRGFVPSLSFGLFEDDKLIAFTLNGIGEFNSQRTAYDTGTGTIKEYRGKGLASKIFTDSLPFLKEAGVSQYLLEVLQHNTSAVSVYRKLGFAVSREFNYFTQPGSSVSIPSKILPSVYILVRLAWSKGVNFQASGILRPHGKMGLKPSCEGKKILRFGERIRSSKLSDTVFLSLLRAT